MKREHLIRAVWVIAGLTLIGCSTPSVELSPFRVSVADPTDVHAEFVILNGERVKLSELTGTLRSLGAGKDTPITLNPRSVVSYGGDTLVNMTLRQAGYTNLVWNRAQEEEAQNN